MSENLTKTTEVTCSICLCEFDLEAEGGVRGFIGILPIAFCPFCKCGVMDFAEQMRLPYECENCGHFEGEEVEYDFTGDDVTRGPVLHPKRDV